MAVWFRVGNPGFVDLTDSVSSGPFPHFAMGPHPFFFQMLVCSLLPLKLHPLEQES